MKTRILVLGVSMLFAWAPQAARAAELENAQVIKKELAYLAQKIDKLAARREARASVVKAAVEKLAEIEEKQAAAKDTTLRFMQTSGERARADDQRRASSSRRAGTTQRAGTTMRASATNRSGTSRRAGTTRRAGATNP